MEAAAFANLQTLLVGKVLVENPLMLLRQPIVPLHQVKIVAPLLSVHLQVDAKHLQSLPLILLVQILLLLRLEAPGPLVPPARILLPLISTVRILPCLAASSILPGCR